MPISPFLQPSFIEGKRREIMADGLQQSDADRHIANFISRELGAESDFAIDYNFLQETPESTSGLLDFYVYGTTQPTERFQEPEEPEDTLGRRLKEAVDPEESLRVAREGFEQGISGELHPIVAGGKVAGAAVLGLGEVGLDVASAFTTERFRERLGAGFAQAIQDDPVIGRAFRELGNLIKRVEEIEDPNLRESIKAIGAISTIFPVERAIAPALQAAGRVAAPIVRGGAQAVGGVARGVTGTVRGAGRFVVRQITGLSDDTVDYIVKHSDFDPDLPPDVLRGNIGKQFSDVLDDFQSAERGLLPEYAPIRQDTANKVVFSVTNDPLIKKIESKGFVVTHVQTDAGIKFKVAKSAKSRIPLKKSEITKLEELLDLASGNRVLTNDEFLNIRGELTNLSRFDAAGEVTKNLQSLSREMRFAWNEAGRLQIKGLKELDAQFSGLQRTIEDFAGDFTRFDKGTGRTQLTDTGYRRLLNLTNRGRERELARLKEFMPDIEDQLNMLRAVEDVQIAGGQKVGTYTRTLVGAGGGAVLGGPIGAIMGIMLSSPAVSVPMLKAYGRVVGGIESVINSIKGKLKTGTKLNPQEAKVYSDAVEHFSVIEGSSAKGISENLLSNFNKNFDEVVKKYPENMTQRSLDELRNMDLIVSPDGKTGVGLIGDEIVGLINNGGPKGKGRLALINAIEDGGRRLDALDGGLREYYEEFGFEVIRREKNFTSGKPDVIFMVLNDAKYNAFKGNNPKRFRAATAEGLFDRSSGRNRGRSGTTDTEISVESRESRLIKLKESKTLFKREGIFLLFNN